MSEQLTLYNGLTRTREPFSKDGDPITLYVCGITPYDTTHIGHCFTYTSFDVLLRFLRYQGHDVRYVQNVTDIDDDILRKAGEVEADWREVGNRWTTHFVEDMQTLNVLPPQRFPRATDVIEEIVETVEALLERGYAYEVEGNVYFHVDKWEDFGKLSRIPRHEMLDVANERGNHPDDPHKKDPLDFVLWQAQAADEPAWESPWGLGRPGWHIECSTMAATYLGETIDIHGGGADLIFPHHECEIAQAEGATGTKPFVRFWLHTAMVRSEGEKMSKSLGNLVMVRDLLERGISADALRVLMHMHHYRVPWQFEEEELRTAIDQAQLLRRAVAVEGGSDDALNPRGIINTFETAMCDDLDTPTALAALQQYAKEIISAATAGGDVSRAQQALRTLSAILGLRLDDERADPNVRLGWNTYLKEFS